MIRFNHLLVIIFTFFISVNSFSQTPNYKKLWDQISQQYNKNLPVNALKLAAQVYQAATKASNETEQLKSLLFQIQVKKEVLEDGEVKIIAYTDSLIAQSKGISKAILLSIQANQFWNYLQQNRYRIYNRTEVKNDRNKDISTWTAAQLNHTIAKYFTASLQDKKYLQSLPIEKYEAWIIKGDSTRLLRPTWFDLLAHQALQYYTNGEAGITNAADQFTLSDAAAFLPAEEFSQHPFAARDSQDLHYQALLLYQQIIAFHVQANHTAALIDADLDRLKFVLAQSTHPNKKKLYLTALQTIQSKYPAEATAA